jgi:hypothetical protein
VEEEEEKVLQISFVFPCDKYIDGKSNFFTSTSEKEQS